MPEFLEAKPLQRQTNDPQREVGPKPLPCGNESARMGISSIGSVRFNLLEIARQQFRQDHHEWAGSVFARQDH